MHILLNTYYFQTSFNTPIDYCYVSFKYITLDLINSHFLYYSFHSSHIIEFLSTLFVLDIFSSLFLIITHLCHRLAFSLIRGHKETSLASPLYSYAASPAHLLTSSLLSSLLHLHLLRRLCLFRLLHHLNFVLLRTYHTSIIYIFL